MVPVSSSCGWRMAWVVTLPVVLRRSWWWSPHPTPHTLPGHTTVCILWHYGLCLFDIAALCSSLIMAKTKDIVSAATKRSSFFGALRPVFHHHLSLSWWRLCPLEKEGWTRVSIGVEMWGVGTNRGDFTYGWNQRREAYFYSSNTFVGSTVHHRLALGSFLLWSTRSEAANVSGQAALALQSLRCFPLSHFCQCFY